MSPVLLLVVIGCLSILVNIATRHYLWRQKQYDLHRAGLPHEHLWEDSNECDMQAGWWRQQCSVCEKMQD